MTNTNDREAKARELVAKAVAFREGVGASEIDPGSIIGIWMATAAALESTLDRQPKPHTESDAPAHWSKSERAAYDCGLMDGRAEATQPTASELIEAVYCAIHGDLLDGPRSGRCSEAPPGHEYATLPASEPTEAQVEAAAKAHYESFPLRLWSEVSTALRVTYMERMRSALSAAANVGGE